MSDVAAILKVMPESPEIDLEALKETIKNTIDADSFERIEEEPIGFGLIALNVTIVVDDGEGGTEPAEEALAALDEIQSVEVTDVRRLM
ncbi:MULTISPECIES: elongation factor 1-beta [Methanosphaera]|jgi:elongation factor 1-beta|uniref:Elongation factor 1-beta n=2 Tax=Methanosphaera stadtmanae TaxID=2317 RepID=EF1B_METST|nr:MULTISPECIES: elongation factor 1-beta [Methanosphaera]Q2NF63.1 RecName: Full=Elongation factor 1-beta; Short=EF-1-beta; AltName: Full=aEF-1beta [Methanosphaera stadtmanae DSM 3091]ABC57540.1 elongation factor 1-beta (aEF-1beta) (ef1B) [Methanosphaera stadtmanae DSM 3091]MDO5822238.1 elongation factor 1-beta [Methanosphaera sp.]MEE0489351.1 elongation factor 1-beta [Methanosphaera stadtmanae]OEC89063.1 elongation factor 1-beta [Methanosphaera sp. A6]RAP02738.1 elongation factor 1-beta [Met